MRTVMNFSFIGFPSRVLLYLLTLKITTSLRSDTASELVKFERADQCRSIFVVLYSSLGPFRPFSSRSSIQTGYNEYYCTLLRTGTEIWNPCTDSYHWHEVVISLFSFHSMMLFQKRDLYSMMRKDFLRVVSQRGKDSEKYHVQCSIW